MPFVTRRTVTAGEHFSGEFFPQILLHLAFNAEFISTLSHNNGMYIEILKQKQLLLQSIKH